MAQNAPADARRCHNCDGFPAVKVTTDHTNPDGTRHTRTVTCRACNGTGFHARRVIREVAA
ncbi:hypothetical protein ACFYWU_13310 [Streptomyces chrestomyceticus]|uniref:hypothetical protein n=1 Tax=Streptomyces chrestomyceticus TaxID=68185 RepID=UPI003693FC26